jgi:hypothetical protein
MEQPQILKSLIGFQSFFFPPQIKPFEVFFGMVGYYQRFIHMFAAKTRQTQFQREDAPTPLEDEASKCAFEQFKSTLQVTPILRTLD